MLNLEQIRNIRFHKARRDGYLPEEVDHFIEEVVDTFEAVLNERNEEKKKLEEIQSKLDACRARESSIGEALLIAQHQADIVVNEAQSRAELIVEEAHMQAKEIIGALDQETQEQKQVLNALRQEVSSFKGRLLQLYREHLTLIDAMPESRPAVATAPAKVEEEKPEEEPEAVPAAEPEAKPAAPASEAPVAEAEAPQTEEAKNDEMPTISSYSESKQDELPSLFTEDDESEYAPQPAAERFSGLQFGKDYEEPASGGLFRRKK